MDEELTITLTRRALFALMDLWNSNEVGRERNGIKEVYRLAIHETGPATATLQFTTWTQPID